MSSMKALGS